MRVTAFLIAILALPAAAAAQWTEYVNREDGFRVDFPGQPTVTTTTFTSEYGSDLPARVYTVERGGERYSVTVADYRDIQRIAEERAKKTCPTNFGDERACGLNLAGRGYWKEEIGGALLHATFGFVRRNARVTHLAWAWQDLVEGHEIQMVNANQSRTFAYIAMHRNRLYILEGTAPDSAPPPALFQQSLGFVDPDGRGVRYQSVYSNRHVEWAETFPAQPLRAGQGGAAAPAAAPAPR
jgi:hypothetical protein